MNQLYKPKPSSQHKAPLLASVAGAGQKRTGSGFSSGSSSYKK